MCKQDKGWHKWWLAPKTLKCPGDWLTIWLGLPFHTLSRFGREPASTAFFKNGWNGALYSRVTNNTAPFSYILCRNSARASGTSFAESKFWLYIGKSANGIISASFPFGNNVMIFSANCLENDSLRKEPTKTAILSLFQLLYSYAYLFTFIKPIKSRLTHCLPNILELKCCNASITCGFL